jgi:subtilase family serine protease
VLLRGWGLVAAVGGVACLISPGAGASGRLPSASGAAASNCLAAKPVQCFTPQRFRSAYGIAPLLDRGIDGRGETVVIVDQIASPLVSSTTNIRLDVAAFDSRYDLPKPSLTVVGPSGAPLELADLEEVIDVEMVHTVAPGAAIRVVLVSAHGRTFAQRFAGLRDGLSYGAAHGDVTSISFSFGAHCFTPSLVASVHAVLQTAQRNRVTVVASSGDFGVVSKPCASGGVFKPVREVGYPASDPLVLAAGGTKPAATAAGQWVSEIGWHGQVVPSMNGEPAHTWASGGGYSDVFAIPGYQKGTRNIAAHRGVPDVAADASDTAGLALVQWVGGHGKVTESVGTSAAAPMWAGVAALADQYAGHRLGFLNPAIYAIARGPHYHAAFHDVVSGNNAVLFPPYPRLSGPPYVSYPGYRAVRGWDAMTGWGSPDAQALVPLLAHGR